jgi:anti-sigma B factor antagonist
MGSPDFEVRRDGDRVSVIGELDLATAPELGAVLDTLDGDAPVIVDLSGTTFIDSQGLATLTAAKQRIGNRLRVTNVGEGIRRVFEITKLDEVLLED